MSDSESLPLSEGPFSDSAPDDPLIGRKLGDFLVREKLGQGGLGAVYRVTQPTLGREAVIKVLHPRNRGNQDLGQRFLRESRLASKLDHPYAAHIYAFGAEPDGLLWIAMELVRGNTLAQMLATLGPLPLPVLSQLLDRMAEVIHSAHEQGIIHRDLKPTNVMVLNRAGRLLPKLVDFGLAKLMQDAVSPEPPASPAPASPGPATPLFVSQGALDNRETPALPSSFDPLDTATPALGVPGAGNAVSEKIDAAIAAHFKALGLTLEAKAGKTSLPRDTPIPRLTPDRPGPPPPPVPLTPRVEVTFFRDTRVRAKKDAVPESRETRELARGPSGNVDPTATPVVTRHSLTPSISDFGENGGPLEDAEGGRLTPHGRYLGTPHYMAPEQWRGEEVDARSDQYALGVLCFEALTGHLPFPGPTVDQLRAAHLEAPVPPLPDPLPHGVHAVLARAMAKKREDRYPNALEFAGDLRAAAGLHDEPPTLPKVDETVRELFLYQAPQHLAETFAAFESARSEKAAADEVSALFTAVAHTLGIIALSARARVGPGGETDSQPVLEALRALRKSELSAAGWIAMAQELCRPFARKRDAHPVPELVSFFFEPGGDQPASTVTLVDTWRAQVDVLPKNDDAARAWLKTVIPNVSRVLAGLNFLHNYRWVAMRAWLAEEWMGIRRVRRPLVAVKGDLPEGEPALVTRDGSAVLSLYPLVQRLAPTPGAAEELFFFDGHGRLGARLRALPTGFERHDESLSEWLRKSVADVEDASRVEAHAERSPYRGLETFAAEDAENYFGREREAEAFANRLRSSPLLAVVGPSGVGKSSFVQAGVGPLLPAGWKVVVTRPGPSPIASLVTRLATLGLDVPDLRARMIRNPSVLHDCLRAVAPEDGGLLLVVDQFEELLTLCHDPEERGLFSEALVAAAPDVELPIRVVVTLRDDFLIRAQRLPGFHDKLGAGLQLLATPALPELVRTLTEPARSRGVMFEDPELPREMAAAVSEQPGALAILSFAASKLWEVRDRTLKVMTRKAYQALGGVGGALAQHAEATLAQMPPDAHRLTREAFRHLVSAEGTRAVLTRAEMGQVLGGGPVAESVLETLISARLLVASEAGGADDRVEVIHEALLSSWPRLVRWQREDAENARMRDQLRAAARQWEEKKQVRGVLWRGEALTEYRLWRNRYQGKLTTLEEAFAKGSLAEEARGQRLVRGGLVALFVTLLAGAGILYRANERAQDRLHRLHAEQGRLAYLDRRPLAALVYLTQALEEGEHGAGTDYLVGQALTSSAPERLVLAAPSGRVTDAIYSPDESIIATASVNGSVQLWNAVNGTLLHTLAPGTPELYSVAFSPDGQKVAVGATEGITALYDVPSGQLLHRMKTGTAEVYDVRFTPDGASLVATEDSGTVTLYDVSTGAARMRLRDEAGPLGMSAVSGDGKTVVACTAPSRETDGLLEPKVWSLESGAELATLAGHRGPVRNLAFSPDSTLLATASTDGTVKIWDAQTWKLVRTLEGHWGAVLALAWRADGKELASGSSDQTIRLWNIEEGSLRRVLAGHAGVVRDIHYDGNGTLLASASDDGSIRLWSTTFGREVMNFAGHSQSVRTVRFDREGHHLLSSSYDGTARVWDADKRQIITNFLGSGSTTWSRYSPDGRSLIVAGASTLQYFDLATGALQRILRPADGTLTTSPSLSPDGSWFTANGAEGTYEVTLNDARTGARLLTLQGHRAPVESADTSLDGTRILTSSDDQTARIWDAKTGAELRLLQHKDALGAALFSPDGTLVLTGTATGHGMIWDARSGQLLHDLPGPGFITSLAFSPDGRTAFISGTAQAVGIWDVASGRSLGVLEGHTGTVNSITLNAEGTLVVTGSHDGTVKVWDVSQRMLVDDIRVGEPVASARFSPRGDSLAVVGIRGTQYLRDSSSRAPGLAGLQSFVRCKLPYALRADQLVTVPVGSRCTP